MLQDLTNTKNVVKSTIELNNYIHTESETVFDTVIIGTVDC